MFLTSKSRIWQTYMDGRWKLVDNELYLNHDGTIQLCPRYFWSDGYTYPSILLPLTGDRHALDVRPAHQHDLECRFHQRIIVHLTLQELVDRGYLRNLYRTPNECLTICEDIPRKHLEIVSTKKRETDDRFRQMMLDVSIDKRKATLIRLGVFFNINWLKTGKADLNDYNLYNEDIGLVKGL